MNKILNYCFLILLFLVAKDIIAQPGSNDFSFNTYDNGISGGGITGTNVYSLAIQTDGKIIVVGNFTQYNNTARKSIARLNSDGSLDTGFNIGTGPGGNGTIYAVAVQSDGKILIGGYFNSFNGTTCGNIARLNSDGSVDTGFNSGGAGCNNVVNAIVLQTNGKIIIAGAFSTYNGVSRNRIARLITNGSDENSLNFTFTTSITQIKSIALQADGKIIWSGQDNNSYYQHGRINSSGSQDAGFNLGADALIYSIVLQPDGKVIIGGDFTGVNGYPYHYVMRLNANGSNDSFNSGGGPNGGVRSIALQSDGKIIIAGVFTSYAGTTRNRICRLNSDGSIDTGFDPGTGFDVNVNKIILQPDEKIIAGGLFSSYNSVIPRHKVARINGSTITFIDTIKTTIPFNIYPNPATTQLTIKTDNTSKTDYTIYDVTGRILTTGSFNQNTTISISDFAEGNYFIQLTNNQNTTTKKFIKQ